MSQIDPFELCKLLQNDQLGAGNFLHYLLRENSYKDHDYIFLERPIIGFDNTQIFSFSHQSLLNTAKQWSAFYHAQGVTAKDVIAVFIDDTIDYFIQFIALSSLGAVPALINSKLAPSIAIQYIQHIEAKLVLTTENRLSELTAVDKHDDIQFFIIDEVVKQKATTQLPTVYPFVHNALDPVLLTHTSGTTGIPKAVIAAHKPYFHGIRFRLGNPIDNLDRYLTALPHSHNSGLAYLMEASMRGCPTLVLSDKSPKSLAAQIDSFKPNFVVAFPKIFVELVRDEPNPELLQSVNYWRSTGDAAHERHVKHLTEWGSHFNNAERKPGSVYIDGLGSSEMGSSLFTVNHYRGKRDYDRCVGKPQPWVDAQVLDDDGNLLPAGQVGRLGIKSPSLTPGYWNSSLISEKSRVNGYWITGDLVRKDTLGYFYHLDRITDKIETQDGTLYSLLTEELILKRFDEIFDCSIYTYLDDKQATKVAIRVDLVTENTQESYLYDLLSQINAWLQAHNVISLNSISVVSNANAYAPEGVTGKVLKRVLRHDDQSEIKVFI
ncbi:class I adenylate-forming enzyme family protein [Pseudoalteromonas sp. PS5]|uniref:class I adenylate-forming enzyme family protein n=1 Tax=Pseudoalteromonas sp. PS5 TaxID=1437473 RepID=UPI000FFE8579|nr:class I adenylate-forming enzyme family protein [Pseudoalteromonas sp. PS5]RXE97798.1 long-chain fatty acid--CoA ligase [Pseudoalteromonas sp. PS5]